MPTLSEARLQHFVELAQLSLHSHELYSRNRDAAYQEILTFVDSMVDLMLEVRRERAALEQLASLWDQCLALADSGHPAAELALRMCVIARTTLDLPVNQPAGGSLAECSVPAHDDSFPTAAPKAT